MRAIRGHELGVPARSYRRNAVSDNATARLKSVKSGLKIMNRF